MILSDYEKVEASKAAQAYLVARARELTDHTDHRDKCWYILTAEVRWMAATAERLGLKLDTAKMSNLIEKAMKSPTPRNQVEQVAKRMLEELDRGRPCSAKKVIDDVQDRERKAVDAERDRQSSRQQRSGFGRNYLYADTAAKYEPVSIAFRGDPALTHLEMALCWHAELQMQRVLLVKVERAYFKGRLDQIPGIWREAHAEDPAFEADSILSETENSGITTWCRVGAYGLVDALRPMIEKDGRYKKCRQEIKHSLPPADKRPHDIFAPIEAEMKNALDRGYAIHTLTLYDKYVVGTGQEDTFLAGNTSRCELVEELRALAPLEEVEGDLPVILNFDRQQAVASLESAIARQKKATLEMKTHPRWWHVEVTLVVAEIYCGRYGQALDRFIPVLSKHPTTPSGEPWEYVVRMLYADDREGRNSGWIYDLYREGDYEGIREILGHKVHKRGPKN